MGHLESKECKEIQVLKEAEVVLDSQENKERKVKEALQE